jgi:hypothetical protein
MYCWIIEKNGVVRKPISQYESLKKKEERTGASGIPVESRDGVESHSTIASSNIGQRKVVRGNPRHPVHELALALSSKRNSLEEQ